MQSTESDDRWRIVDAGVWPKTFGFAGDDRVWTCSDPGLQLHVRGEPSVVLDPGCRRSRVAGEAPALVFRGRDGVTFARLDTLQVRRLPLDEYQHYGLAMTDGGRVVLHQRIVAETHLGELYTGPRGPLKLWNTARGTVIANRVPADFIAPQTEYPTFGEWRGVAGPSYLFGEYGDERRWLTPDLELRRVRDPAWLSADGESLYLAGDELVALHYREGRRTLAHTRIDRVVLDERETRWAGYADKPGSAIWTGTTSGDTARRLDDQRRDDSHSLFEVLAVTADGAVLLTERGERAAGGSRVLLLLRPDAAPLEIGRADYFGVEELSNGRLLVLSRSGDRRALGFLDPDTGELNDFLEGIFHLDILIGPERRRLAIEATGTDDRHLWVGAPPMR